MTFSTRNDGFKVTFPNGYTVSIGTGQMHYCENYTNCGPMVDYARESKDCEIAVIRDEDGEKWSDRYVLSNDVEGYITPLQFSRVIAYVSSLPVDYVSQDIVATLDEILESKYNSMNFEENACDPVFPVDYPSDEDWDAPTNP